MAARRVPQPRAVPLRGRARTLGIVAVLAAIVIVVRLVVIQGTDSSQLAAQALQGRLVTKVLPADRGVILAGDGTVLADNADRYQLVADQRNVADYTDAHGTRLGAWGAAKKMAPVLGTDAGLLYPKLSGDRLWAPIATGITSETWQAIEKLKIPGITVEKYTVRSYPSGAIAGNILGWVGSDGQPLAGLELKHQRQLQGKDGSEQYERGLKGDMIPLGETSTRPPVNGTGLQITVDPEIQFYAQRAIADAVKKHSAQWGSVVVEEIGTGRLVAVAQAPTVDPNNPAKAKAADRGARAFTDSFEPGSTAKVITAAALLEEGRVRPDSRFTVPYKWKAANGEEFRDSHKHGTQKLTFAGIIQDSSNTGTLLAGEKLSRQQRFDYLHRFGFGTGSGIPFPGATAGILRTPDTWDGRTEYTVMFGQGIASTALQNTSAMATIGNRGQRVPQQLVKGTVDDGGTVTEIPPQQPQRVVSEKTAAEVMTMLEGVVARGTGTKAQIPGYRVAGKTGTAQAPAEKGGGYSGYTSSFSGIAPADNPKFAVTVTLQRPRSGYYGGTSAAPVFADVTGYALKRAGVAPSQGKPQLTPREWK